DSGGVVRMSGADVAYYSGVYASQYASLVNPTVDEATYVANAIQTLELSLTQQYLNLKAKFGAGGTYQTFINSSTLKYDPTLDTDVTATNYAGQSYNPTAYNPATYNSNFSYLLSDNPGSTGAPGEVQTLSAGIKIWTTDQ